MNPIIGLIVLPTSVIAYPILGINIAKQKFIVTRNKVIKIFYNYVNFLPPINNSSIESLLGKITRGKLEITENNR